MASATSVIGGKYMSEEGKVVVAFSTCPTAEAAQNLAKALVDERLAACVNVIPGLVSTYRWQSKVEVETEALLIIKTTEPGFSALKSRLIELHPYELPEVIAIPVCAGAENYLDWVRDSVK
jgi:periplasmic divalent cation tolerance protein